MSIIYSIRNTANTDTVIVRPGTRNGPDGALKDSDINLHGMGSVLWGEEVGENFIRLTENFACPEQVGSPGGVPQTSAELGLGFGINNPIPGQLWFNTTAGALMVWDGVIWKQSGGLIFSSTINEPGTPSDGDLWFNTDFYGSPALGGGQLMIYNDGAWESVSEENLLLSGGTMSGIIDMGNNKIINVADPTNPQDVVTINFLQGASGYVAKAGDTMTGDLDIDTGADSNVTFSESSSIVASVAYATTGGTVAIQRNHLGGAVSESLTLQTGLLVVSGGELRLRGDPVAALDAAPKQYVDAATNIGSADNLVRFFSTTGSGVVDGDVRVQGGIIYIYDSGWKQVFPAIYS